MSTTTEMLTIAAAMTALTFAEAIFPFKRAPFSARRTALNLSLTVLTFALNAAISVLIVAMLAAAQSTGFGLLHLAGPEGARPPAADFAVTMIVLDLAFYGSHVAMHKSPLLWRYHRLHHADEMIDATTAFRQHPVEGAVRYAAIGAAALALGASPAAYIAYRFASALSAVLEHANVAVPMLIARALALVTSWPLMHKIHHSSAPAETDSNYGNLLSVWDRLFSTYTPLDRAGVAPYGLGDLVRTTAIKYGTSS